MGPAPDHLDVVQHQGWQCRLLWGVCGWEGGWRAGRMLSPHMPYIYLPTTSSSPPPAPPPAAAAAAGGGAAAAALALARRTARAQRARRRDIWGAQAPSASVRVSLWLCWVWFCSVWVGMDDDEDGPAASVHGSSHPPAHMYTQQHNHIQPNENSSENKGTYVRQASPPPSSRQSSVACAWRLALSVVLSLLQAASTRALLWCFVW